MLKVRMLPLFCGLGLCASASAGEHDRAALVWSLPNDLLKTSNQISFNQGARGAWYFMQSASFEHDPILYSLLPDYQALCEITPGAPPEPAVPGLPCWKLAQLPEDLPQADLNVTNTTQVRHGLAFPPHAFAIHPSPTGFAIVAWKSPIHGKVKVSGSFTDLNPCGNGVLWTIDQGKTRLASGQVNASSQGFNLSQVRVAPGQVLYFVVDPGNGDFACDTTQLKLTITAQWPWWDHDEDSEADGSVDAD
jgi:hypothetical protein